METAIDKGGRFYARIWRWHFFAAMVVIPFVLWQAVTGTLYLWHRELATAAHPELLYVAPGATRVSYESQLHTVLAHHANEKLTEIHVEDDPARSTAFFFTASNQLAYPAFVDPYSGKYLGAVTPATWLPGITRSLHGGWPLGHWGSNALELGASWAIVMILTGLYLWWPRNAQGLGGVLYPRLRAGSRVFWRDLHSIVGIWFSVIVLSFLLTALPWTKFWGGTLLGSLQRATGQVSPTAAFFSGGGGGHDHRHEHGRLSNPTEERAPLAAATNAGAVPLPAQIAPQQTAPLDAFIAAARAAELRGPLEIRLGSGASPIQVRSQTGRAFNDLYVQLDRSNASVLSRSTWSDWSLIPRVVALGVNLHEGTFFGRANQLFNTTVALSLVWLSVTGFMGWYRRRPGAGLSAPPKRPMRSSRPIVAFGVVLGVLLPLLGLSMLCILAADYIFGRWLTPRSAQQH